MQSINLYSYNTHKVVNLHIGTEGTSNMQFQNNTIEVYKGANNPIKFTLLNADNKPLSYSATKSYELVVYSTTGEVVIRKLLTVDSTNTLDTNGNLPSVTANNFVRTVFSTDITVSDLSSIDISNSYKWIINCYDQTTQQVDYFYSSLNGSPQGDFYIKPFYSEFLKPSNILTNWKQYTEYRYMNPDVVGDELSAIANNWNVFISDVIDGNTKQLVDSSEGTVVLYLNNFTGVVSIQGTLEALPPDDQSYGRWFNIPDASGNTLFSYDAATGTDALIINGKFSYIRIVKYQKLSTPILTVNSGDLYRALVRF